MLNLTCLDEHSQKFKIGENNEDLDRGAFIASDRIIQLLIEKGFLRTSTDGAQAEVVFDPVK